MEARLFVRCNSDHFFSGSTCCPFDGWSETRLEKIVQRAASEQGVALSLNLFESLASDDLFDRLLIVAFPAYPTFEAISPEIFVIDGLTISAAEAHRNFDLQSQPKLALTTSDLIIALTGYGDSSFPNTRGLPPGCFEKQSLQAAKRAIQQVDDFNVYWTVDSLETATARLRMSLEDFDLTQDALEALTWKFSYAWK